MKKKIPSLHNEEFLAELTIEPLTKNNWGKFEELFGEKVHVVIAGACSFACLHQNLLKAKPITGIKTKRKNWYGKASQPAYYAATKAKQLAGAHWLREKIL
jgi:hypothetical protein